MRDEIEQVDDEREVRIQQFERLNNVYMYNEIVEGLEILIDIDEEVDDFEVLDAVALQVMVEMEVYDT